MTPEYRQIPVPGRPGTLWAGPKPRDPDAPAQAGVQQVVCLIPLKRLPPDYAARARAAGHRFYPVPDFGVPSDPMTWDALVEELLVLLDEGHEVLVHCHAGCGRTGTLCACILTRSGLTGPAAIEHFKAHRGCGPETQRQRDWVVDYASRHP